MEQKKRKMKIEGVAHAELNGGETSSSRLGIEKDTPDIQSFSPAQNESLRKDMKTETSKDDVDVKQKEKIDKFSDAVDGNKDCLHENSSPETVVRRKKRLVLWSAVLAGLLAISFAVRGVSPMDTPISTSVGAQEILKQQWSDKLELGARLVKNDDQITVRQADMVITHDKTEKSTKVHIWDYAAEDGDYVQLKVDGVAITEPFMIHHKQVSFDVPAESKVEVVGIRDGGGGITYAIRYDVNGTVYLNGMGIGGSNTYTLTRSQVTE
ncbi:hypothetical protein SAMN05720766_13026 [Fibrobacter sp. UWH9]|uniref:hypothetical protein n=1 Tax=unclassified Fibrobacter TaxID=2634177 RepID=UPI000913EB04|nr:MULTISPECIES: hypothetical protein [unclassified Fibrobacter]OWV05567.1 hypothetical protein B7993_08180 [Fibrobacter sp. UWH3]OWV16528.1 hypothetical protein B7992_02085 [Fibrobacter sp. UWH1]SHH86054.1 hypothetical protein SAMN05720766_13026 [Fibrobacter sp. UWH9]SHK46299.1 hypothetical protein SAMN05720765_102293 [Fibrobacter sp. UWH6]